MQSKLKLLFCSPYIKDAKIIPGGVGVWGKCVLEHYYNIGNQSLKIYPISFDRHRNIGEVTDYGFKRIFSSVIEIGWVSLKAIAKMIWVHPQVMHLCTSASLSLFRDLILVSVARILRIKPVIHLHFGRSPELKEANNWEWKLLLRTIKKTHCVVVMDKETQRVLNASEIKNVRYIPNPVSSKILNYVTTNGDKVNRIPNQLLFVGHVLETKGVYELVRGCVKIPNAKLRIVGKASTSIISELEKIAKERDNGTWLTFVGEIPHDNVLDEFCAAEAFVFPSYTEGFPNVILEAMACGCPIVSSSVGAIPEMLDVDGEACGICIPPCNADAVRNEVTRLLEDADLRKNMSLRAKHRVFSVYSIDQVWADLVSVWNS